MAGTFNQRPITLRPIAQPAGTQSLFLPVAQCHAWLHSLFKGCEANCSVHYVKPDVVTSQVATVSTNGLGRNYLRRWHENQDEDGLTLVPVWQGQEHHDIKQVLPSIRHHTSNGGRNLVL